MKVIRPKQTISTADVQCPLPPHHQKHVGKKGLFGLERVVYLTSFPCASFKTLFPTSSRLHSAISLVNFLQPAQAILLVNVPVSLLLLPPVQDHGHAEYQDGVEADDAESCREDEVEVLVREGGEFADAAALLRGNQRVGAGLILDEGRGSRVKVSAAVELSSVSAVFGIASA